MNISDLTKSCTGCKFFVVMKNGADRYFFCQNERRWKEVYGYFKHGGLLWISEYDEITNNLIEKIVDHKYKEKCEYKEEE